MKLAYRKIGSGKPLLILHGLFGQSDNWNSLAKQIANQNFEVFTIDARNHGLSPHHSDMNHQVMAHDVFEFLNEHHIHNPIIIGHSMGGKTALFFDILYPNLISKNIIVDIAPKKYSPHHQTIFEALMAVNLNKIKSRKEAEQILQLKITEPGVIQFLLKNLYWLETEMPQLAWRFNLTDIIKNYPLICEHIPEQPTSTETLFIRGELSKYILDEDVIEIKKQFTQSEFITIPKTGHWVHAEQPQLFLEALFQFIL